MKSTAQFFCIFLTLCIVPDPKILPKSFTYQEETKDLDAQNTLEHILDELKQAILEEKSSDQF